jgi:glycosyltransferase involved in cell wall biosynthesis
VDPEHGGEDRSPYDSTRARTASHGSAGLMTMPTISVLMTAFNRERYIAAAIDSVLAQTFADFELVIVDDQSTDGTVAVARSYEARDVRVRVVVNERNLGDYPNRNRAAERARGRYMKYHDSDDIMYPHCLETMVSALDVHPEAGFALTAAGYWHGGPCPMLSTPRLSYQREFLGYGMFMCGPAGAMFRTDVFRDLGGFETAGVSSDHLFWLRACARVPVVLVAADLFWYRVHDQQELRSSRAERDALLVSPRVWAALNAPDCPLDPGEREIARRNHAFVTARAAWRDVRRGRVSIAAARVRQSGLTAAEWARYLRPPVRRADAGTPPASDRARVLTPGMNATRGAGAARLR